MKNILRFVCAGLLFVHVSSYAADAPPLTVAVLPFEADEALAGKAAEVATLLTAQLSAKSHLWVLERADLDKVLGEQAMQLSGLTNPAQAVQVGKLAGAQVLVTGRLMRTGGSVVVIAKVISTESTRVFGESATGSGLDALKPPTDELGEKVAAILERQDAAFRVPVVTRDERIKRLEKAIAGKSRPSVMVRIPEQELTRAVIDPAVETEFKKSLLELGFEVIDPKSGKVADVVIEGEAFSETGARRGQLVSARARAEVQARRSADSSVLAVDRETTSAIDTAASTAGKSALQEAGLVLVERMVPKIVGS